MCSAWNHGPHACDIVHRTTSPSYGFKSLPSLRPNGRLIPPLLRHSAHHELENASMYDVRMRDEWCCNGDAVGVQTTDVRLRGGIWGGYTEGGAVRRVGEGGRWKVESDTVEEGAANDIISRDGVNRIESQSTKEIPCAHLSTVFVSGKPIDCRIIVIRRYLSNTRLGFRRRTG